MTETKNQRTIKVTTRFLNLIIPIHVNNESKENKIANKTATNTRSPMPNPRLNIKPSPLNETKKEKIPIIHVIRDIRPMIVKIVLRYGCNLWLISFTKWALRISFINLRLRNFDTYPSFFISFSMLRSILCSTLSRVSSSLKCFFWCSECCVFSMSAIG